MEAAVGLAPRLLLGARCPCRRLSKGLAHSARRTDGLASAAFAGICYAPHHDSLPGTDPPRDLAAKYAEIVVFIALGIITGVLSDYETKADLHSWLTAKG